MYNKIKICYTEVADFTDFQGIGRDPLYKRFDSVNAVVEKNFPEEYRDFLAQPLYSDVDDCISWYVRSWNTEPTAYKDLSGADAEKYKGIKERTVAEYRRVCLSLTGQDRQILEGAIKYVDEDMLFCYDNKVVLVAWGMTVDVNQHVVKGKVMQNLIVKERIKLHFQAGEHGRFVNALEASKSVAKGSVISSEDLPAITPKDGYVFRSWSPDPVGLKVTEPMTFVAQYEYVPPVEPEKVSVRFMSEEGGELVGQSDFFIEKGTSLLPGFVPEVKVAEGYKFEGWTVNPASVFDADTTIMAMISKEEVKPVIPSKIPWYKRFWAWLKRSSWWKWLLALLLLLLLLYLLKDCSCSSMHLPWDNNDKISDTPPVGGGDEGGNGTGYYRGGDDHLWGESPDPGGIYSPTPTVPKPTPPEYIGVLPPNEGVLPPLEDDPVVIPGHPYIIGNRLNILMENPDKSILDLAKAFKREYPRDTYKVIYYDDVIKRMQIMIPPDARERLKEEIPAKFSPEYSLFVFDEALFEGSYKPNDPAVSDPGKAWYLDAVNAFEAWDITRGSEEIVVAIVDNGFNLNHPELKSKVYKPYNVWTHSNQVSPQLDDHGTHVSGTAVAIADNAQGISGIAPKCKFMPVQVANSKDIMTVTSVLDGVLYAIYQGADVVNLSLGYKFKALSGVDESYQKRLIQENFKEEERLWREISRIAARYKATIVVAAGNDTVLAGIDALQRPDNVIVVSAVNKNMSSLGRAWFSNYGDYSTISAPGVGIYSTVGSNNYQTLEGTSMAAPIVTGAVALMKSLKKDLTSEQIISILQETGLPVHGKIGKLIQIDKALKMVMNGEIDVPTPVPSTGDVQILLSWNNYNDVDLRCVDPSGNDICYSKKTSPTGGQLEIDMNVSYPSSRNPIENIYWPSGRAPQGTYKVYVTYYRKHEGISAPYKVTVKYGSKTEEYTGVLNNEGEQRHVCNFTLTR